VLPGTVRSPGVEYDNDMSNDKRPHRLLTAIVVLAVLLGGAVLVLVLRPGTPTGHPAPPAAAPPAASPPAPSPPRDQQVLTAAPAGVSWELFQGVALPVSGTDGPTRARGAVHAGFSHTATGALLADAQIGVRRIATPSLAGLRLIGQQQLVDGPGKTAYLNLVASLKDNTPPAGGYTQYVGFRYIAYSPELAVVSLATRSKNGVVQVGTDTLRWTGRDWQLELPASGLQQPQVVPDTAGYVPWARSPGKPPAAWARWWSSSAPGSPRSTCSASPATPGPAGSSISPWAGR